MEGLEFCICFQASQIFETVWFVVTLYFQSNHQTKPHRVKTSTGRSDEALSLLTTPTISLFVQNVFVIENTSTGHVSRRQLLTLSVVPRVYKTKAGIR